jgi:hypothetical protein
MYRFNSTQLGPKGLEAAFPVKEEQIREERLHAGALARVGWQHN